ncbi:unnamed protein product [Ectocarpus sp. 12 AP-2014]
MMALAWRPRLISDKYYLSNNVYKAPEAQTQSTMAIRSVDEIINLSDSSKNPEKPAFKDLVQHIDPRIRERAPRHTSLNFKIPGILWGQPVFDADRVASMIVRHYKRLGFQCVKFDKREILIKWGQAEDRPGEDEDDTQDSAESSSDSSDTDSGKSTEPSETGTTESAETTDTSDNDDEEANKTKCVTVEQLPLSKRLSIVNNQLQRDM